MIIKNKIKNKNLKKITIIILYKGVSQVLTIMAKKNNIVVPIAWVIMGRRTTR